MADLPEPTGKTVFGVHYWVVPGAQQALTWGGDYNMVRRCSVVTHGGSRFLGDQTVAVSGRCVGLAEAQRAVASWLAREVSGG